MPTHIIRLNPKARAIISKAVMWLWLPKESHTPTLTSTRLMNNGSGKDLDACKRYLLINAAGLWGVRPQLLCYWWIIPFFWTFWLWGSRRCWRVEGSEIYKNREAKFRRQLADTPKLYWIAIGKDDFLYKDNEAYRKALDDMGVKYDYHESAGGHIWKNWRAYLSDFTRRLFR